MKINDLQGMLEIIADEGKVLTTAEPSDLRVKLLYIREENKNTIIEIDEYPVINLPEEELNVEEVREELNGYSLTEAYHLLMNENRVMKDTIDEQDQIIDLSLTVVDEMYTLLEPLMVELYSDKKTANPLIKMYLSMVEKGLKQLDEIPEKYKEEVSSML